jgi:hypothetical protein
VSIGIVGVEFNGFQEFSLSAWKIAGLPKELVLYCARHDYGTRILTRTGNLAAVMKTMGHHDVKTAMHYQHPELEIVRAALDYGMPIDTTEAKAAAESLCGTFRVPPKNHDAGKLLRTSSILH